MLNGKAYVLNNAEGGSATMYVLAGASQPDWANNVSKKVGRDTIRL